MSNQELSPREVRLAQRRFYFFTALNVISFQLLSGNIITLYALRLGATNFLIGALYSFVPMAQVMPLVGRAIVARLGAVRTFSMFWLIRYVLMAPILFAPVFAGLGRTEVGIFLIVISVIGFNMARGIGITGHNPIIAGITSERDRGSFLARLQLIIHSGAILTGASIALFLGADSAFYMYTILLGTGILAGLGAARVVARLPEPPEAGARRGDRLGEALRKAFRRSGFRRFLVVLSLKSFLISMVIPFLVVYMKRVYDQGDSTVIFFSVFGSLGAVVMALVSGIAIDTTGPKPISQIFAAAMLLSLLPAAVAPTFVSGTALWVFAGIVFFLGSMGAWGLENGLNAYFFGMIDRSETLNLGTINFLATGAAATVGSLAGGAFLDILEAGAMPIADVFRIYFGVAIGALLLLLGLISTLPRLGVYSVGDVLSMFLSPRDLRALGLLHRIRKKEVGKVEDQQDAIRELGKTQSNVPIAHLLSELQSPRFAIRAEALSALALVRPDEQVRKALIEEVRNEEFTTAYIAADILGRHGVKEAVPVLREGLESKDFFLAGKCMVALAHLGDRESLPRIERIVTETHNPRLIIHGATALELFGGASSVPLLIRKLQDRLSAFARDEINLAVAGVLGLQGFYYPIYLAYLEDKARGVAALKDYMDERLGRGDKPSINADRLRALADAVLGDETVFSEVVSQLFGELRIWVEETNLSPALVEAACKPSQVRHSRFRYLLAAAGIRFAFDGEPRRTKAPE